MKTRTKATVFLGTAMALMACSWFSGPGAGTVAVGAGKAAACVLGQVEQGVTDPGIIVTACAGVTLDDVVAIVESLINYYLQDGGMVSQTHMTQLRQLAATGHLKLGQQH